MKIEESFYVKLFHCGNVNIADANDKGQKNIFYMPMGFFPLADILQKNGFQIEIIHSDLEKTSNIEEILDFSKLDAIGFDCHWVAQSYAVMETARLIKKIKPQVFIFLGGFSASFFVEEIIKNYPEIDAVIRGDGELPLLELCQVLQKLKYSQNGIEAKEALFKSVKNLVWRDSRLNVMVNEFAFVATAADLEKLDFAAIELLRDWPLYRDLCRFWTKYKVIHSQKLFLLEIGRGCSHNCSICGGNSQAQYIINRRMGQIQRSQDSIMQTIQQAVKKDFTLFYTCCDFDGSDQWYIELFSRIHKEQPSICFGYGCWRLPSAELIDALAKNIPHSIIELSPESGDYELRCKNRDPRIVFSNEELDARLDQIKSKGNIKVQLYFGYFIPFDSESSVLTTLNYMADLQMRYGEFIELFYVNCSTDPGSSLYLNPEKYQVDIRVRTFADYLQKIKENYVLQKKTGLDMTEFKPSSLSETKATELSHKIKLFNSLIFYFPKSIQLLSEKVNQKTILGEYLQTIDLTKVQGQLSLQKTKAILMDIFQRHVMLNAKILQTVHDEYQAAGHVKENLML